MKSHAEPDQHDPRTTILVIEPDGCTECEKYAKCKTRLEGRAYKCKTRRAHK